MMLLMNMMMTMIITMTRIMGLMDVYGVIDVEDRGARANDDNGESGEVDVDDVVGVDDHDDRANDGVMAMASWCRLMDYDLSVMAHTPPIT
jgi:hypothetical protein